jgi:hypothetical protein
MLTRDAAFLQPRQEDRQAGLAQHGSAAGADLAVDDADHFGARVDFILGGVVGIGESLVARREQLVGIQPSSPGVVGCAAKTRRPRYRPSA